MPKPEFERPDNLPRAKRFTREDVETAMVILAESKIGGRFPDVLDLAAGLRSCAKIVHNAPSPVSPLWHRPCKRPRAGGSRVPNSSPHKAPPAPAARGLCAPGLDVNLNAALRLPAQPGFRPLTIC